MHTRPLDRLTFSLKGLPPLRAIRDRNLRSLRTLHRRQATLLRSATLLTVTGPSEARELAKAFGPLPMTSEPLWGTDAELPAGSARERSGVLCVAHLDPRKNQLALIKALENTGLHLSLIGTDKVFPQYARTCRDAAGATVEFAGYVPQDELPELYRGTRVHALPSFFELPGLTTLDATGYGAAVVATTAGTVVDYLGKDAHYCTPDISSIRAAVLRAYEKGAASGAATRIASTFTWRRTAELCLGAYDIER